MTTKHYYQLLYFYHHLIQLPFTTALQHRVTLDIGMLSYLLICCLCLTVQSYPIHPSGHIANNLSLLRFPLAYQSSSHPSLYYLHKPQYNKVPKVHHSTEKVNITTDNSLYCHLVIMLYLYNHLPITFLGVAY